MDGWMDGAHLTRIKWEMPIVEALISPMGFNGVLRRLFISFMSLML